MTDDTQRRLAAIVSLDVVGYSRMMERDEARTLESLRAHRSELVDPLVRQYAGRIVKTMGDGLLLEFPSAVKAVDFALSVQEAMAARNGPLDEDLRVVFRIGVSLGDIVVEGNDIFGDGVILAARLQEIADPGTLYLAGGVYDQVAGRTSRKFADIGYRKLKNIAQPQRVYHAKAAETADAGEKRRGWPYFSAGKERQPFASGGCFCGKVRFTIWAEPSGIGYCHCRMCQLALGGPLSAWAACDKKFVDFEGEAPRLYQSSPISERAFCGNCGTSLYTVIKGAATSEYYSIRLAAFDHPENFPPSCHFGVESQMPWLEIKDDLPRIRTEEDAELAACWTAVGQPKGGPVPGTAEQRWRSALKDPDKS